MFLSVPYYYGNINRIAKGDNEGDMMEPDYTLDAKVETDPKQVFRYIQRLLQTYKEEKRGPTFIAVQSSFSKHLPIHAWSLYLSALCSEVIHFMSDLMSQNLKTGLQLYQRWLTSPSSLFTWWTLTRFIILWTGSV